ncbi:polysaccharide pyruvyl transferase family protein [Limisphaera sp. 4302-co]|uniref:polysaccharide pyruvyl transferase family protein n=1 Tax=Limisphaera sp. 4302-co TaxID=3400417 RepID=UPI003C22ABD9
MLKALLMAQTSNLGDDIQAWPVWKFWGTVDAVLDRDTFDWWYPQTFRLDPGQRVAVVVNGWYTYNPTRWLPPSTLVPFFISVHISPEIADKFFRPEVVEYLSRFEIGARDLKTVELLKHAGLKAYFSGCLTLTVSNWLTRDCKPDKFRPLIIDLHENAFKYVPREIIRSASTLSQEISPIATTLTRVRTLLARTPIFGILKMLLSKNRADKMLLALHRPFVPSSPLLRLTLAEMRLQAMASASVILTSRLHVALPAASLGVPVVLVHPRLHEDPRFSGLSDLVISYDLNEFKDVGLALAYDQLSNPNAQLLEQMKRSLLSRLDVFRVQISYPNGG